MRVSVQRDYSRDYSDALGRDMEILRFGVAGTPILAFPTSQGRFYQWEDFGLVGALTDWIEEGRFHVWCVDSVDSESWYAKHQPPGVRVERALSYERYLLHEVVPHIPEPPIVAGPSFGAFHALLLAARHPTRVRGFIGMSGAFDNARWLDGYSDENTYYTNLLAFLPGLHDETYLRPLRAMHPKVIVTGQDDPNVADSVRLTELLQAKGVEVVLDLWPGWAHDWPYWKDMLRKYLPQ